MTERTRDRQALRVARAERRWQRKAAAHQDRTRRALPGRALGAALLLWTVATGCAEPAARDGAVGAGAGWRVQGKALDAGAFVVLVVRNGAAGLTVERAGAGELASLRARERKRVIGEPAPERQEHALCARLLRDGTDTGLGRCVPWHPPHAAPERGLDAAHADTAGAVSIRLAWPRPGEVWSLQAGAGAAIRWPAPGAP